MRRVLAWFSAVVVTLGVSVAVVGGQLDGLFGDVRRVRLAEGVVDGHLGLVLLGSGDRIRARGVLVRVDGVLGDHLVLLVAWGRVDLHV